jgi:prevent-host-death family protein
MRRVSVSMAKSQLGQLLTEVATGETIVITRRGRPVGRLEPERRPRPDHIQHTMDQIKALRATGSNISLSEILEARHTGHRY